MVPFVRSHSQTDLTWIPVEAGAVDAGHEPSGCLHRLADNDVLFNRAFSRKRNRQRQLICADRIPKLVEARVDASWTYHTPLIGHCIQMYA